MIKTIKDLQKDLYGKLAPYATKISNGRTYREPEDQTRLPFQLDRDRIIHCKAFRRLSEKTQVFTANHGDHYRTRLTHTMEVAQISRDIARTFALNEDLAECIALAHDLGHAPFGHAGEDVLNELLREHGMHFEHNEQSRRTVEYIEKLYPDFDGLNLTFEVLDGLVKHRSAWDNPDNKQESHLEAQVVNLADEIAYTSCDIDDGLRSGLFTINQLEDLKLWQMARALTHEKYKKPLHGKIEKSRLISALINILIEGLSKQTSKNIDAGNLKVEFTARTRSYLKETREFLYKNFYLSENVQSELKKGQQIIRDLFGYFTRTKNPESVRDYIAGMTDGFAIKEHERLVKNA